MIKKVQTPHLKKKKTLQFCHFYARLTQEKLYNSVFLHNRPLSLHNVTLGTKLICIIIYFPILLHPMTRSASMAPKKQLKNYHLFFKGCLGITVKNFKKFSPLMSLCYFFFIHWTTPYNNLHWLTSFFTGLKIKAKLKSYFWTSNKQRAKKVVSHSVGLVDFAIGLVNFVFNLPDGQVKFF